MTNENFGPRPQDEFDRGYEAAVKKVNEELELIGLELTLENGRVIGILPLHGE